MDFNEVCCNIRSCLNSSKSQLSLTQLIRDYREVLGDTIPYRKLGYNSLEDLIRAVPNLRISNIRGETFIDVKPDEKTAHIAELVREQRGAKKKKRKPSRGLYRGSAPPPRRPAPMPPPRRSAPPSRSFDYYPSRPRDTPPRQQSYSNQRRPSPPRRPERDNYYSNRKDIPSYQDYRNPAAIEISSDEDDRRPNIDEICRKYRSHPTQYDFSDPNDDVNEDGASDLEDCDEINTKIEQLKVTLGRDRQVSINKPKLRSYSSNTSNEDDIGYSSMKTSRTNGAADKRFYYRTPSSSSYYDDDDTSSATTTPEQPGSGDGNSSASQTNPNRQPFNRSNRSEIGNPVPTYSRVGSRGRGYLLENAKKNLPSVGRGRPVQPAGIEMPGNIKVTVPNGTGRARVVDFLLR